MDQNLQNQLTGAILKVLPVKEKPKRRSYQKSSEIVKKSVKGKTKNISKEQGFRQYLKYTDPLLLNNNELDQSDLAKSFGEILNVFTPQKMNTEKIKEVERFIALEKPVDTNDVKTEVKPELNPDQAATKIAKVYKGLKTKENYKLVKNEIDKGIIDKSVISIESDKETPLSPFFKTYSMKKALKKESIDTITQAAKRTLEQNKYQSIKESADILKKSAKRALEQKNYQSIKESADILKKSAKTDDQLLVSKDFANLNVEANPQRLTKRGQPDKRFKENKSMRKSLMKAMKNTGNNTGNKKKN